MGAKSKKQQKEEHSQKRHIVLNYQNRLVVLKKAREFAATSDIANAVMAYKKYLSYLCDYLEVEETKLAPKLFNQEKELAEILLISQVYWDLAKAYDRNPKFVAQCEFTLNQFVNFTLGFKFQYINAELIRKFLRRKSAHNPELFEAAYKKIHTGGNDCFIATYCFSSEHETVFILRQWKTQILLSSSYGRAFIDFYYKYSPRLIRLAEHQTSISWGLRFLFRPLLAAFAKAVKRFIL